jgi:hypothetical protein
LRRKRGEWDCYLSATLFSSWSGMGGESSRVGNRGNGRSQDGGLGDFGGSGGGGGGAAAVVACRGRLVLFLFNDMGGRENE